MRRNRRGLTVDFRQVTLLLDARDLATLDRLTLNLGVERQGILMRGLFMMDVAHTLNDMPPDATARLSVHCGNDGAEMLR